MQDLAITTDLIHGKLATDGIGAILPPARAEAMGKANGGQVRFMTLRGDDPTLAAQLEQAGVRYTGQPRSQWLATLLSWMLPVALFFGLTAWLTRKSGIGAGWAFDVGKSRARVYLEDKTGVRFDDVAGIDEARDDRLVEVGHVDRGALDALLASKGVLVALPAKPANAT